VVAITLSEAKLHCRVDINDDDALIAQLINAAVNHVEQITGWVTTSQLYTKLIKKIPEIIRLPLWPVTAITAIEVIGATTQNVASDFDIDLTERPAKVIPLSKSFSVATGETLLIAYTAGEADIPDGMRQAVLMLVAHWYENREAIVVGTISSEVSLGVNQLLSPYMARRLA
jgi:uncharacterized phiE125 gp8 family phage protein